MIKRLLLMLGLAMCVSGFTYAQRNAPSSELSAILYDTIVAADTADESTHRDTLYTGWLDISMWRTLYFVVKWDNGPGFDTALGEDSVYFELEHSSDRETVTLYGTRLATILNGSADLDTVVLSAVRLRMDTLATAAQIQRYIRARIIHIDSADATRPGLLGRVIHRTFSVYVNGKP